MMKRRKTIFVPAQVLTAGTCNSSIAPVQCAELLTSTVPTDFGEDETVKLVGTHRQNFQPITVSFARAYFQTAIDKFKQAQKLPVVLSSLLSEIVTNLHLGLTNLFGQQWTLTDQTEYKRKWEKLHGDFQKSNPSKEEMQQFRLRHPKLEKNRTFSLLTLVKVGYPLAKGWSLENERKDLFDGLVCLNNDCKDVAEHTDRQKLSSRALKFDHQKILTHVTTTREIVVWFMEHFYDGNIPDHARKHLEEVFGS